MLEDILLQVNKPGRYIGREWNIARKDFDKAEIRFALCFPDLYEIGMSNLGMQIIYGVLNGVADVACERFFSPDIDMENILRHKRAGIFSLESKRSLSEFDIIGFSLNYELNYTNVLNILNLGQIPLESSARDHRYPLVFAGGPCTFNPEPMHEFFDLFIIGEAEEVILKVIEVYREHKGRFKASKIDKHDLLVAFSGIEGVYVPSLYEVEYDSKGKIAEFKPKINGVPYRVNKCFVEDLDQTYFPLDWIVPYIQIVHDRITLEIMRGCPNKCRFCQARSQYFPFRQRDIKNIIELAKQTYRRTGYEEISLGGLSVSDYSNIEELLANLIDLFKEKGVSISLPSIKPKMLVGNLSSLIATVKKTGLTFAPEAATARLRRILDKDFDVEDLFKVVELAYLSGYQHVKLYFMIGIPCEGEQDLDGIIELATDISELRRRINKGPAYVNVSINTLIPKPHTPFQWLKMEDLSVIRNRQNYLRKKASNRRLKLSFHNCQISFLEGVLSRGDRRLGRVIMNAFQRGARFDAWQNYFKLERWMDAFAQNNVNPDFYLNEKAKDEIMPWDFIDTGIKKESLLEEFNKISEHISYGTRY